MSNQELMEILNKRIELYFQILKESDIDTTIYNEKQKEREKNSVTMMKLTASWV